MSTPNDAIALTEAKDSDLLRNFLIKRIIYALEPSEDPTDFEALDSDTGAIPQALAWQEKIFWLDADDTTTPHDGTTTLRTNDDYCYKANDIDLRIAAVLDRDLTAPPVSGSEFGDAYLVPAGATGDWADYADYITVYTARGWQFITPTIGRWLYVEDEDVYLRYSASGDWSAGQGARSFDSQSIPASATINFGKDFIVENQTTNTPPSSPAVGVAYIIGPSPTGLWAGKPTKIAVWESSTATDWTYYTPAEGWRAYDKATNQIYTLNDAAAWVSAAGVWVGRTASVFTAGTGSTTAAAGTTSYTISGTAPTTSARQLFDTVGITHQAKVTGATLQITYDADVTLTTGNAGITGGDLVLALYRDSETTAIDWHRPEITQELFSTSSTYHNHVRGFFEITTGDALSHTYKVGLICRISGATNISTDFTSVSRRRMTIQEAG